MAWTDIPDANIEPDKSIRATDILAIRDNIAAQANGDPGAPQQQTAGIADFAVNSAKLANSSVSQSKLRTAVSTVSATNPSNSAVTSHVVFVGGSYGFYPQTRCLVNADAPTGPYTWRTSIVDRTEDLGSPFDTGVITAITLYAEGRRSATIYAASRYVTACPPYDLGDGEIPQFIFATVQNSTGAIESVYSAEEAPWHHNGPTDIRADYYDEHGRGWREETITETTMETDEDGDPIPCVRCVGRRQIEITQEIKQADMHLIPHPFIGSDLSGKTVVMLDPVCSLAWTLAEMHRNGESPNELLHDGYLRIGNDALTRKGPPGVMVVKPKWRNNGGKG